jgi:hypothetical protein
VTLLLCAKLAGMLILFVLLMALNTHMTEPPMLYVLSLSIGISVGWVYGLDSLGMSLLLCARCGAIALHSSEDCPHSAAEAALLRSGGVAQRRSSNERRLVGIRSDRRQGYEVEP